MTEDIIAGALVAARDYLRLAQNDGTTYGYYPGGDPRDFSPDSECARRAAPATRGRRSRTTPHKSVASPR